MRFVIAKDFLPIKSELDSAIAEFDTTGEFVFKGNRNTIKEFKIQNYRFVIKSFKKPNLVNKIAYRFLRKSKAERSFLYANRLLSEGINTPLPVGFYENRKAFFLLESYYISLFQQSDMTFRDISKLPVGTTRFTILKEFTIFTKKMHDRGILFKDHSPGNTLIKEKDHLYEFYLIDLNRMRFKTLTYEDRIKNFDRLTTDKANIKVISDTYADLIGKDKGVVYRDMSTATERFHKKNEQKRKLKRKFFFWIERYKT